MNQVKKHCLLAIETIQHNRHLCIELKDLWQALYQTFDSAQDHQINKQLLDEISTKSESEQLLFLKEEFRNTIKKYNNILTLELDHIFWKHLKFVIDNDKYFLNICNIANVCINLSYQPSHFKISFLIIISKPNKNNL